MTPEEEIQMLIHYGKQLNHSNWQYRAIINRINSLQLSIDGILVNDNRKKRPCNWTRKIKCVDSDGIIHESIKSAALSNGLNPETVKRDISIGRFKYGIRKCN